MIICPNTSCGNIFDKPLKALNLQNDLKPYYACPFCLTKVTAKNESTDFNKSEELSEFEVNSEVPIKKSVESQSVENPSNVVGCRYHFGYLGERTQKDQIPDDCIVCMNIVDCMLKKMNA